MLFNSIEFFIFFPVVFITYYLIPHRFRWVFLLIASYYFYMSWKPEYAILIMASTVIDYFTGLGIGNNTSKKIKLSLLAVSLCTNLGLLFTFKYFNFFVDSLNAISSFFPNGPTLSTANLILPVGISFYTFQTLSYTIDIYKGGQNPERNFGKFALFVSFFPQLVAGPIERSVNLLPQFNRKVEFNYNQVVSGMRLMLWGLFKKMVIADRLALIVNEVYGNQENYMGFQLILGTVFFAFQIYCDFSGYSDIAIGLARTLGFDLMTNFKLPYFSKNIREFWSRWHISLSTWFRDYVYVPLGGNRVTESRWFFNLFITFLISGLWHGANWTFVIWGALHGMYLIAAIIRDKILKHFNLTHLKFNSDNLFGRIANVGFTFALACIGWVFFRADNVTDAFNIISNMTYIKKSQLGIFTFGESLKDELLLSLVIIPIMILAEYLTRKGTIEGVVAQLPWYGRWMLYLVFGLLITLFSVFGSQEFIYFQF